MASPSSNQPALLRLPAELRNEIYAGVFTGPHGRSLVATSEPGLLRTCRQIRREALGLFYSSTELHLTIKGDDTHPISRWLDTIPSTLLARIPGLVIDTKDDGAIMAGVRSHGLPMPRMLLIGQQQKWYALGKAFRDKGISAAKVNIRATDILDAYIRMIEAEELMVFSDARDEVLEGLSWLWGRGDELLAAMVEGEVFTAAENLGIGV